VPRSFQITFTKLNPLACARLCGLADLRRRHSDESQRAMVAARIATLNEGRPTNTAQICAVSQEEAAQRLNVGRRSVQYAREVLDEGAQELISASGLKREDDDLIVIESVEAAMAFKRNFEARFASGFPLLPDAKQ